MLRSASERSPLIFVARYLWRYRRSHGIVALAVLGAVAASVAARYSMKFLVDAMSEGPEHLDAVWQAVVIFAGCVGADNLLWRVAGWAGARGFPAVGAELRRDLFGHLLGQSTRYFNERFSGALASRITTAANGVFTVENGVTWNVLPAGAATVGALLGLGTVDWRIAAALAGAAALIALGIACAAMRGRPLNHAYAERAAEVAGEIVDAVANHAIIRMFANGHREERRLEAAVTAEATAHRGALLYIERLRLAHAAAVWVLSGVILAWSIKLWADGAITSGDVVVCGTFTLALLQASRDLAVALVEMSHHWSRVAEAVATLAVPHELPDHPAAVPLARRGGRIVFDNVSFGHEPGRLTLDRVSLRIAAGQRVGIVGPSGAGKSSLLALVQRLYPARSGRILIDGQDIAGLGQESLRRAIAVVPQDISLFHRSILENIRYGRPEASDGEVIAAARAARCDEFIRRLPEGYATLVGERGICLSVGQKQRVAIARAFLADAPILLLDEATSALDTEAEIAVQHALSELLRGRTILAVAHRLSTVIGFDRIVVLDEGRIVEEGSPGELRRRRGIFARLWRAQTDDLGGKETLSEPRRAEPVPDAVARPPRAIGSAGR